MRRARRRLLTFKLKESPEGYMFRQAAALAMGICLGALGQHADARAGDRSPTMGETRPADVVLARRVLMAGIGRETGMIGKVADAWRAEPRLRNPGMHDELMRLWVEAEVARLTSLRLRQRLTAGQPGPEGAGMKVTFARLAQAISGFEIELDPELGLRYDDWTMRQPEGVDFTGREPGYRYLRAKGNSIEGGTSEILRNTVAERILGLPPEHRVDKDLAFKDLDK